MNPALPCRLRWRLECHDRLASTQTHAIARAEAGEAAGLAVLAAVQDRGRGSRGRQWASLRGNLHLSVLLRPSEDHLAAPLWSLLGGVVLAEALAPLVDDPSRLMLKHPNDVLLDGAKLAGILVEAGRSTAGLPGWLVMGFGVNLRAAPAIEGYPTTALAGAAAIVPAPETFAPLVLARLGEWYDRVSAEGDAALRRAWIDRVRSAKERV